MNLINTIVEWVVFSSKDPARISLTVRGILVGVVPFIIAGAGLADINVGPDELNGIVDSIIFLIQAFLTFVAASMTVWGLVRKLLNTIKVHQEVTHR